MQAPTDPDALLQALLWLIGYLAGLCWPRRRRVRGVWPGERGP